MNKQTILLILSTLLVYGAAKSLHLRREVQAVSVQGRLYCGNEPMKGVAVKLIDRDHGNDRDDLLDEKRTDEHGMFHVTGGTQESTLIEPAIKIYHDCNDGERKCQKRLFWDVPQKYVTTNLAEIPVFNVGSINLELMFGNEQRDCRH